MSGRDFALPVDQARLAEHYKEVEAFQTTRAKSVRRISTVMAVATSISILANLALAWTVAIMVPLERIVPVYLLVRQDGTIDTSVSLSRLPATQSQAVVNTSLWEYVRLREGFTQDTARYSYDVVSNYSAPKVREQYQRWFNYPNPESPQVTVGKRGAVEVEHIASADIARGLQQIRYKRTIAIDGKIPVATTWTATLGFATVNDLPASLRLTNPGGVVITSYQASEDSVEASSRPAP